MDLNNAEFAMLHQVHPNTGLCDDDDDAPRRGGKKILKLYPICRLKSLSALRNGQITALSPVCGRVCVITRCLYKYTIYSPVYRPLSNVK